MALTIKTDKGTELPLLEFEGGVYLEAKWRVFWFRQDHERNKIQTEVLRTDDTGSLVKATVYDSQGGVWATAHKFVGQAKYPEHLEAAETGAVARALSLCGYGTQFGNELKEAGVSDGPVHNQKSVQEVNILSVIQEIDKILSSKPEDIAKKAIQKIFNKKQMARIKTLDPEELQSGLDIMKTQDFWTHLSNS